MYCRADPFKDTSSNNSLKEIIILTEGNFRSTVKARWRKPAMASGKPKSPYSFLFSHQISNTNTLNISVSKGNIYEIYLPSHFLGKYKGLGVGHNPIFLKPNQTASVSVQIITKKSLNKGNFRHFRHSPTIYETHQNHNILQNTAAVIIHLALSINGSKFLSKILTGVHSQQKLSMKPFR